MRRLFLWAAVAALLFQAELALGLPKLGDLTACARLHVAKEDAWNNKKIPKGAFEVEVRGPKQSEQPLVQERLDAQMSEISGFLGHVYSEFLLSGRTYTSNKQDLPFRRVEVRLDQDQSLGSWLFNKVTRAPYRMVLLQNSKTLIIRIPTQRSSKLKSVTREELIDIYTSKGHLGRVERAIERTAELQGRKLTEIRKQLEPVLAQSFKDVKSSVRALLGKMEGMPEAELRLSIGGIVNVAAKLTGAEKTAVETTLAERSAPELQGLIRQWDKVLHERKLLENSMADIMAQVQAVQRGPKDVDSSTISINIAPILVKSVDNVRVDVESGRGNLVEFMEAKGTKRPNQWDFEFNVAAVLVSTKDNIDVRVRVRPGALSFMTFQRAAIETGL